MRRAVPIALLAALVACTGGGDAPVYDAGDLEHLVLTDAPPRTIASDIDPVLDLDDVAAGSDERRARFEGAGFVAAYQATFTTATDDPRFQGFLLTSRAYLFSDPQAGLEALHETIKSEGSNLTEKAAVFLDRPGFTLTGILDAALPAGVAIAWLKENVVLVLAVVAVSAVSEQELREIARKIDTLEPPLGPPV